VGLSAGSWRAPLEPYPPLYLVINLSRFPMHLIPDFIAVLAFEKQNITQPKTATQNTIKRRIRIGATPSEIYN
jgi:hypothetical protein